MALSRHACSTPQCMEVARKTWRPLVGNGNADSRGAPMRAQKTLSMLAGLLRGWLMLQELAAEGDRSCLYDAAKALLGLQSALGCARVLKGKGAAAQAVRVLLTRMRRELSPDELSPPGACRIPLPSSGRWPNLASDAAACMPRSSRTREHPPLRPRSSAPGICPCQGRSVIATPLTSWGRQHLLNWPLHIALSLHQKSMHSMVEQDMACLRGPKPCRQRWDR